MFCISCGVSVAHNSKLKHTTQKYLKKLTEKSLHTELNKKEEEFLRDLKLLYPLFELKSSLRKLQKKEEITDLDLEPVIAFVDCFTTVTLNPISYGLKIFSLLRGIPPYFPFS